MASRPGCLPEQLPSSRGQGDRGTPEPTPQPAATSRERQRASHQAHSSLLFSGRSTGGGESGVPGGALARPLMHGSAPSGVGVGGWVGGWGVAPKRKPWWVGGGVAGRQSKRRTTVQGVVCWVGYYTTGQPAGSQVDDGWKPPAPSPPGHCAGRCVLAPPSATGWRQGGQRGGGKNGWVGQRRTRGWALGGMTC